MPRKDIEFSTVDGVKLRGWFYTPEPSNGKLPCLVMAHGFSAVKEMDLDLFAEKFVSELPIACLVYDNRGFGASDGEPRQEIDPWKQQSDYSDAITHAQMLPEVEATKIGIWGSSYSGGHVLWVGATDRRVKAVLSQVPLVSGWENLNRLVRPDLMPGFLQMFEADRHARAQGKAPGLVPVVSADPTQPSALPTAESFAFFDVWEKKKISWKNEVTMRSIEMLRANEPWAHIHHISPTPLLMTVAEGDTLTPTDISIEAFARAREPKQLHIIPGGHFDGYSGPNFEKNAGRQVEFLRSTLCSGNAGAQLPDRTK